MRTGPIMSSPVTHRAVLTSDASAYSGISARDLAILITKLLMNPLGSNIRKEFNAVDVRAVSSTPMSYLFDSSIDH